MELPVLRRQPPLTLSTRQQQVPQPAPSLSSILTLLDSSFFSEKNSTNQQNPGESSSKYCIFSSSLRLLAQQSQGSTYASTIPDVTSSSIVDVRNDSNTTPVTARDFIPKSFIHFPGSTAGIGLAKRWRCKYCMISSSVYLRTNQAVF